MRRPNDPYGWVAVILSIGIVFALNVMTVAALWVALQPFDPGAIPRLGENSTQVLLAWGAGILSILSVYVGYMLKKHDDDE